VFGLSPAAADDAAARLERGGHVGDAVGQVRDVVNSAYEGLTGTR
jgi:hypothetical protein